MVLGVRVRPRVYLRFTDVVGEYKVTDYNAREGGHYKTYIVRNKNGYYKNSIRKLEKTRAEERSLALEMERREKQNGKN